jgi:mRNA interferase RelE/StbE
VSYTIEFSPRAARQFKDLPKQVQVRLRTRIDALSENPRPRGVEKLKGEDDLYRVRVGDYRVIYQVKDKALIVLIVKIGDRKEVYKRF